MTSQLVEDPRGECPGHLSGVFWNIAPLAFCLPRFGAVPWFVFFNDGWRNWCFFLQQSPQDPSLHLFLVPGLLPLQSVSIPAPFLRPLEAARPVCSQGSPSHLGLRLCSFLASFLSLLLPRLSLLSCFFNHCLPTGSGGEFLFAVLVCWNCFRNLSLSPCQGAVLHFFSCFLRMTCGTSGALHFYVTVLPLLCDLVFLTHFGGSLRVPRTQRTLHVLHLLGSAQLKGLLLLCPPCAGSCALGSVVTARGQQAADPGESSDSPP